MINPIITETKSGMTVTMGAVRLSYPHLFEVDQLSGKYTASLLIPTTNGAGEPVNNAEATLTALRNAIAKTVEKGVVSVWKGSKPKSIAEPIAEAEGMEGTMVLKCSTKNKPTCMDAQGHPLTDPEELYGGCWVAVTVGFAPYDYMGKKGVTCYLNAVRKMRDGERFGGDSAGALRAVDFSEEMTEDEDL